MHLNRFVSGQFPVIVYGPLLLGVMCLNPLLKHLRPQWCLSRSEFVVIITITLVAASIVNNGLLRYFTRTLAVPIQFNHHSPFWREQNVIDDVPDVMLPNGGEYTEVVAEDFMRGLGDGDRLVELNQVPWREWSATLIFWGSIILLFAVASVCLALIVHPQWSKRELLRYPIPGFARTLLASAEGVPIYRRPLFRLGAVFMLVYHLNNGAYVWWPDYLFRIPLSFSFHELYRVFDPPYYSWGWASILRPTFLLTAVALAFFLSKDITFTVGISIPVGMLVAGTVAVPLLRMGLIDHLHPGGDWVRGSVFHWQRAGSGVAFAFMLIYIGRHYYWQVLRRSMTFRHGDDSVEEYAVQACRVFLAVLVLLVLILVFVAQLDWPLAVAFVLFAMLSYLLVARIASEFGVFCIQTAWLPVSVLLGLFGARALGMGSLVTLGVLSVVLLAEPQESLMAFVSQGLRIGEGTCLTKQRLGRLAIGAFAIALVVAIPFAIWVDYSYGGYSQQYHWDSYGLPRMPFRAVVDNKIELKSKGELNISNEMRPLERVANIRPDNQFLWSVGAGIVLVVLVYMARLRWTRWPLHPVLFLIWETRTACDLFWSFLLAWSIQVALTTYGTQAMYRKAKDFMIGIIAGELTGALFWMMVGAVYYFLTSEAPRVYGVFPR